MGVFVRLVDLGVVEFAGMVVSPGVVGAAPGVVEGVVAGGVVAGGVVAGAGPVLDGVVEVGCDWARAEPVLSRAMAPAASISLRIMGFSIQA